MTKYWSTVVYIDWVYYINDQNEDYAEKISYFKKLEQMILGDTIYEKCTVQFLDGVLKHHSNHK